MSTTKGLVAMSSPEQLEEYKRHFTHMKLVAEEQIETCNKTIRVFSNRVKVQERELLSVLFLDSLCTISASAEHSTENANNPILDYQLRIIDQIRSSKLSLHIAYYEKADAARRVLDSNEFLGKLCLRS
ncbi:hypothetical protein BDZ94DRAFT_1262734 [Collybia nuda]|uniref:Uncharacterized protein n=1 Tax=Collybia nuda TaxID=64659 RepID=A0A9P5Y3Z8_9AGAR|nr:hypothetical protein BDZ94DRAFT_1262734 [Collybia nuda]